MQDPKTCLQWHLLSLQLSLEPGGRQSKQVATQGLVAAAGVRSSVHEKLLPEYHVRPFAKQRCERLIMPHSHGRAVEVVGIILQ